MFVLKWIVLCWFKIIHTRLFSDLGSYKLNMTAEGETKDQKLTVPPNSTNDEDITFNFFYDIVKQLILKRNDIGGKLYYNSA